MWPWLLFFSISAFQQNDLHQKQRVEFVLVDVAATRGGQPVTDLKASDFEVKENKKKVDVTFFDILDYRQVFERGPQDALPTTPSATPDDQKAKPLQQIALVLDFELYHIEEILGAFDQLLAFLGDLNPAYRYQIMVYTLDKGMLTEGFEEDVAASIHAVTHYRDTFYGYREKNPNWDQDNPVDGAPPSDHPKQWVEAGTYQNKNGTVRRGGNLRRYDREMNAAAFEGYLKECLRFYSPGGNSDSPCACLDGVLETFLDMVALRTEGVVERLIDLTFKFDGTADMKAMYFVSPGFVLEDVTAVYDLYREYQIRASCGKPNIQEKTYTDLDRARDETPRRRKLELRTDFRTVLHACVANRVMFNTVHFFKGAYKGDLQGEFIKRNGQGLLTLAEKTGGTFHQTGALKEVFTQDLPANRFFYVLGYDSPKGRKGKYRHISVTCKRRGITLRHRDGYYVY